ncbi:hypothetical protein [Clostridium tagluense]|uniref:hypothetical protein n=1 Tax=Clostridium tagluense TaxID=360422 RepID=UPI001C0D9B6B|nr:hypothetical protein [Clostridium tagluense]MBU3126738.1 hypothetical protein [Clostridium tagluense]
MYYGFKINGKHSFKDFGLRIISREFNPPNKRKIKVTVPFMNGAYDFSTLFGDQIYEERIIKYTLDLKYRNKIEFASKKIQITEWLMDGNKKSLYDDLIPEYYFSAECENGVVFNEYSTGCEIEVEFTAEPFKIGVNYVGDDIWDTFNFLEDTVQANTFNVVGTKTINLHNVGRPTVPTVNTSTNMSLVCNTKTYNLVAGDNKFYDLKLKNGDNSIIINGTGTVKILFRKVAL